MMNNIRHTKFMVDIGQLWLGWVEVCQPFARLYCPQKGMTGRDSYLITSRDRSPVLDTTRKRWNSKLKSMVLSGATLTTDAFPVVLALSFLLKEKENNGCPIILTKISFPYWLIFMHVDIVFCNYAIDDISQRRARWERWAWSYLCTYLQKVWCISFNPGTSGILVMFACGVCEVPELLHSNVELRHYGGWHCPQCSLFFRHLTAMSHMKSEFELVVRYLIWMLLMGSIMIIVISSSWITSMSKQLLTPWQEFHNPMILPSKPWLQKYQYTCCICRTLEIEDTYAKHGGTILPRHLLIDRLVNIFWRWYPCP